MVAAETKHHGSYDILRLVLGLDITTVNGTDSEAQPIKKKQPDSLSLLVLFEFVRYSKCEEHVF
jgi:hypothetical protein